MSYFECFFFCADTSPAPNQYKVSHNQRSNLRKTPAYTMGKSCLAIVLPPAWSQGQVQLTTVQGQ